MIKKLFANTQHSEYWWQDALFVGAVSAAVIAHVLFLSVQFGMPQENNTSTKEIAISIRPSEDEIKDADFLAQANQHGSGTFRKEHRISSDMPAQAENKSAGDQQLEALEQIQQKRELKFEEKEVF
jgi:protein TonB